MEKPYFRVGVGAVLYDHSKHIYCFERSDKPELWQFPQGGVDAGESYEAALWRELFEETALTRDQIATMTPFPHWTLYEYPATLRTETKSVVGQVHRWYFLKLQPGCTPDLTVADDDEFRAWQTMSMSDFLKLPTHDFKLPVYHSLAQFYQSDIM